jgi:hypothetical protein
MRTFNTLPFRDKWRVRGFLVRGETPSDPHWATAVVELAESYSRQGRAYVLSVRWLPIFMLVVYGYVALPRAIDGDIAMAIVYGLIVLLSLVSLIFSPVNRPKNMARSVDASRRIAGSDD